MNLIVKKPYVLKAESQGKSEECLLLESYSKMLERNWSFISFMFNGMMRSELKCQNCETSVRSYEPFTTL